MIVQITVSDSDLNNLKSFSDQTTASKAILSSAKLAPSLQKACEELEDANYKLKRDLAGANKIIQSLDQACRATLEITGQGILDV